MSGAALLLPGQGSQYVGMGHDLAEAHDVVRALYERADDVIGESIGRVSWEGPEEELTATQNAQPAILIHSYAVWTLTRDTVEPIAVTAGHSLGELSAHLIAGTFSFEDAVRLVRRRGELMAAAGAERPGTMAAVLGLDETRIGEICDRVDSGIVVPANLNAPGQIVISGDVDAVARASALAEQSGARRVVPLNVSGAFHSPLMESAANGLEAVLGEIELADPAVPVVANATGAPVRTATEALDTLVAQLTSPVRWIECVETMRAVEPSEWIELGPGAVLSGLIRRVDRSLRGASIGDVASVEARLGATDDDAE